MTRSNSDSISETDTTRLTRYKWQTGRSLLTSSKSDVVIEWKLCKWYSHGAESFGHKAALAYW